MWIVELRYWYDYEGDENYPAFVGSQEEAREYFEELCGSIDGILTNNEYEITERGYGDGREVYLYEAKPVSIKDAKDYLGVG